MADAVDRRDVGSDNVTRQIAINAIWGDLSKRSVDLKRFAEATLAFALIDIEKREIIVDTICCIQAAIQYGEESEGNSAAWLYEYIVESVATLENKPRRNYQEIIKSLRIGYIPTLSKNMKERIIPTSISISKIVNGRESLDLRHIIVTILKENVSYWRKLINNIDESWQNKALDRVISRISDLPGGGESEEAWKSLIPKTAIIFSENAELLEKTKPQFDSKHPSLSPRESKFAANDPKINTLPPPEALPVHTDDPALVDQLGREGFATVLAKRIVEAHDLAANRNGAKEDEDANRAFIVHMHGPWGSGKSTVLNFVQRELEGADPHPWLVVDFNAWRSQRLRPPWWALILQIKRTALAGMPWRSWRALRFRMQWLRIRAGADAATMVVGLLATLGAILLFGSATLGGPTEPLKGIAGLISAVGGIYAFSRTLVFGSGSAAKAYEELRADPYGPMMEVFRRLIAEIGQPVIVFIDDLDRCESGYVCDLLENIQTMLRAAPITYLIAADRKWICTSFEKRYADFSGQATDAGRPLGYQFLDKLFQISTNLPVIPAGMREGFWTGLLHRTAGATPEDRELVKAEAAKIITAATTPEAQQQAIKDADNPLMEQAIRAEVAIQQSSPQQVRATEHRLKMLGALIEPNPRAMKRLANAVGMNQARLTLEGRDNIALEALARWTIIEQRWPLLAEWLGEDPARLTRKTIPANADGQVKEMAALAQSDEVKRVAGKQTDKDRLTVEVVKALLA